MVDIRLLAASLTALLEEEHGGTAQLLSLLRREQVALIDSEADEIAALAEQTPSQTHWASVAAATSSRHQHRRRFSGSLHTLKARAMKIR